MSSDIYIRWYIYTGNTLIINSVCDYTYLWLFVVIITLLKLFTCLYYSRYDVACLYNNVLLYVLFVLFWSIFMFVSGVWQTIVLQYDQMSIINNTRYITGCFVMSPIQISYFSHAPCLPCWSPSPDPTGGGSDCICLAKISALGQVQSSHCWG